MRKTSFLIVGLGLMGGSYAMGLSRKGHTVQAVDASQQTLDWAKAHGLVVGGALADDYEAVQELCAGADCVVLALYPKDILPWLSSFAPSLKPGAIVTDLAGVKQPFLYEAQGLLAVSGHEFIACHPMAGREVSGVENATDAMFETANFLIVPTEANTPAGIGFASELAAELGFARVTQLSAGRHDAVIGYVSQLTHAIAVSLMNANDDPLLPAVTGDSFRDLTRIADINEQLWSELFLENAEALCAEIDAFGQSLADIRACVADGDRARLQQLMRKSAERRRAFGGKND